MTTGFHIVTSLMCKFPDDLSSLDNEQIKLYYTTFVRSLENLGAQVHADQFGYYESDEHRLAAQKFSEYMENKARNLGYIGPSLFDSDGKILENQEGYSAFKQISEFLEQNNQGLKPQEVEDTHGIPWTVGIIPSGSSNLLCASCA